MCRVHKFEAFEEHGDSGATFRTEGVRELHIERGSLSLEEEVSVSFDLLKRQFADMVKQVKEALNIPGFFEPRMKLRALWPLPNEDASAADVLRDSTLKLTQDQYNLLDVMSVETVGIVINSDLNESTHLYLELTPYTRDASQLHIDLERYSHDSLETPEVIESWLQEFYDYYQSNLLSFIESFMPKGS